MDPMLMLSIVGSIASTAMIMLCMMSKKPKRDCNIDYEVKEYSSVMHKIHNELFPCDHVSFTLNKQDKCIDIDTSSGSSMSYSLHPATVDCYIVEKSCMYDNVWANVVKCIYILKTEEPKETDVYSINDVQRVLLSECGINDIYRYLHIEEECTNDAHVYIKDNGNVMVLARGNDETWSKIMITPRNECFTYYLLSKLIGFSPAIEEFSWFLKSKYD